MAFTVRAMDAGPVVARERVLVPPDVQAPQLLSDLFDRGARNTPPSPPPLPPQTPFPGPHTQARTRIPCLRGSAQTCVACQCAALL